MNAVGNIAGIVTPIIIGYTVDVTAAAPASPSRTGSSGTYSWSVLANRLNEFVMCAVIASAAPSPSCAAMAKPVSRLRELPAQFVGGVEQDVRGDIACRPRFDEQPVLVQ